MTLKTYLEKKKTSKVNNLNFHLRKLEKEERIKSKISRRKEIIKKIRANINEIGKRKSTEKINKIKSWLSERIHKIDKPLAKLTKKKREKTQITNVRGEREEITTDPMEIEMIIKEYYE